MLILIPNKLLWYFCLMVNNIKAIIVDILFCALKTLTYKQK
jgi:hypothetical protein